MNKKDRTKKNKSEHSANPKGMLEITRSGLGFVVVDSESSDILVRPGDFNTALNGDTVRVKITKENDRNGKKEGKITEVLTRKQTEFVGHIQLSNKYAFFVPDTDKPMPDLFISLDNLKGAGDKERVVAKIIKWDSGS